MKNFLKTFIDFVKGNGKVEYTAITVGNDFSDGFDELVKKNKNLLSDHGINLNKVRFVHTPVFMYDTDKNTLNPTFVAMLPSKKNAPIVEVGKPKNVFEIKVIEHKVGDNYKFIKYLVDNTKRGVVIYIKRYENAIRYDGTKFLVEEGVDKEILKLIDLDSYNFNNVTDESQQIL